VSIFFEFLFHVLDYGADVVAAILTENLLHLNTLAEDIHFMLLIVTPFTADKTLNHSIMVITTFILEKENGISHNNTLTGISHVFHG
jgi:hypothetical protein